MPRALTPGVESEKGLPDACVYSLSVPHVYWALPPLTSPYKGEGIMERTIRPGLATE